MSYQIPRAVHHTAAPPRSLPPIHSASLLQGPAGVSLHLKGAGGVMTRVPLTLAALREIAALTGSALAGASTPAGHAGMNTPAGHAGFPFRPRPGIAAWQALLEESDMQPRSAR